MSLYFSGVGHKFFHFISDFIYLDPLSFFLNDLAKDLTILFIFSKGFPDSWIGKESACDAGRFFSKNQLIASSIFSIFKTSISFIFGLLFIISFFLLRLGFVYFLFLISLPGNLDYLRLSLHLEVGLCHYEHRVGCHFFLLGSSPSRGGTCISCIGRQILYHRMELVLLCPKFFGKLCFHFHLSQDIFLISSFTHWLLSSMFLVSCVDHFFPQFSSYIVYFWLIVFGKDAWFELNLLKFIEACFVA